MRRVVWSLREAGPDRQKRSNLRPFTFEKQRRSFVFGNRGGIVLIVRRALVPCDMTAGFAKENESEQGTA